MSESGQKTFLHQIKIVKNPIHLSKSNYKNINKQKSDKIYLKKDSSKLLKSFIRKPRINFYNQNKIIERTINLLKKKYFLLNEKEEKSKFFKINIQNLLKNKNSKFNTLDSTNSNYSNITTAREDNYNDFFSLKHNNINNDLNYTEPNKNIEINKKKYKNKNDEEKHKLILSNINKLNKKNKIVIKPVNTIYNHSSSILNKISNDKNSNLSQNIFNDNSVVSNFKLKDTINFSEPKNKLKKIIENENFNGFKSTTKLNHYLICDYKTEETSDIRLSKQKIRLSEKTFDNIIKERKEFIYKKSLNYYVEDKDRDKFYFDTYHNKNEDKNENYSEKELKIALNNYYLNKKLENLKKRNKLLKKISQISESYEKLNYSNKDSINYNNLQRIIKFKKCEKKCLGNGGIELKKKRLQKENEEVVRVVSKLILSRSKNETKFKNNTISKFKTVSGLFFGVPS